MYKKIIIKYYRQIYQSAANTVISKNNDSDLIITAFFSLSVIQVTITVIQTQMYCLFFLIFASGNSSAQ